MNRLLAGLLALIGIGKGESVLRCNAKVSRKDGYQKKNRGAHNRRRFTRWLYAKNRLCNLNSMALNRARRSVTA